MNMTRMIRVTVSSLLIVGLSSSAFAGELVTSAVRAAATSDEETKAPPAPGHKPIGKVYLVGGTALFAGGMTAAIYGFLNNRNGQYPGHDNNGIPVFGEATATNKTLGLVGISTAFLGGTVLFFGQRSSHSVTASVAPGRVTLAKQISW